MLRVLCSSSSSSSSAAAAAAAAHCLRRSLALAPQGARVGGRMQRASSSSAAAGGAGAASAAGEEGGGGGGLDGPRVHPDEAPHLWNYVGRERIMATGAEEGGPWVANVNPATLEVVNHIPNSGEAEVAAAVEAAKASLDPDGPWSAHSVEDRARLLWLLAGEIERRRDEFAVAESRDTGKPLRLADRLDVDRAVHNFRFFSNLLAGHTEASSHTDMPQASINYTLRRPVGVVGLITPWNLPLYLLSWKLAPALAMGNAVVAKPSEMTPTTASLLADVFESLDIPAGVFNVVHGRGPTAGQALVAHPDVKAVSFTGGTATGQTVAGIAAPMFKKLSLELGGKNPTVVFDDCDISRAVRGVVRGAFLNSGQICLCGSRILVHSPIYDRFVHELVAEVSHLKVGDPAEPTTDVGAVISRAHRDKIDGFVRSAVADGGRVLCGGNVLNLGTSGGAFFEPTLIDRIGQDCSAVQNEIFGPVATVHRFETEAEAVNLANDIRYGLCASVWTQDVNRAARISEALDVGMVWVNTWLLRDLRTPFGGVKDSGVGREGGHHSLDFFSEVKNVCIAFNNRLDDDRAPKPPPMPGTRAQVRRAKADPFKADRILTRELHTSARDHAAADDDERSGVVNVASAPKPVGAYPHARKVGNLLFLSGIGSRDPATNGVPGGPIRDPDTKEPLEYDIEAQTRQVIENCKTILESSGCTLENVVDVQCFLVDMDRDFAGFNKVYGEYFAGIQASRTTVAVRAMPTPIAVEFKMIAALPEAGPSSSSSSSSSSTTT